MRASTGASGPSTRPGDSFARIALQNGARIDWVQRQLGHASITLTVDRYGRWERKAEKAEAEKLEGAFPVGARIAARTELPLQLPATS